MVSAQRAEAASGYQSPEMGSRQAQRARTASGWTLSQQIKAANESTNR